MSPCSARFCEKSSSGFYGLHAHPCRPLPDRRDVRSNARVGVALLLARSLLSQMDVPARSAYVMSVVTPAERPAAASFTAVPRSLASVASSSLAGAMFAAGLMSEPLLACGVLKIAYDLALFAAFRKIAPRV
jgi:hypothetical protein